MVESIKLIILSFFASIGFGVVFRIEKKHLLWAGLGGALTRCFFLFLLSVTDQRLIYATLASMFAALYAEIMAHRQRTPSTVFLYPSIIPLIPGDLLYNTIVEFILHDTANMIFHAKACVITLAGMSLGFVLVSTITYYKRIYHAGINLMEHLLVKPVKKK